MTNGAQGIGSLGSVVGVNAASKMVTQGFDGGVLVIPSATNLPNNATSSSTAFASNPVSAITKAPSGSTNNCVRPVLYNGSQTQVPGGNFSWAGPN